MFERGLEPEKAIPETVKIEVSADQAVWSEKWVLQRSKYPNKKSHYLTIADSPRYILIRSKMKKEKAIRDPKHGWKYRIIRKTYAKIEVTQLVKTEILK